MGHRIVDGALIWEPDKRATTPDTMEPGITANPLAALAVSDEGGHDEAPTVPRGTKAPAAKKAR